MSFTLSSSLQSSEDLFSAMDSVCVLSGKEVLDTSAGVHGCVVSRSLGRWTLNYYAEVEGGIRCHVVCLEWALSP